MAAKKTSTTKKETAKSSAGEEESESASNYLTPAEKRRLRQIDSHRENEARWLQKVLFAFGKARDARAKLSEATKEELNPLITVGGDQIPLDILEEIIQKRVDDLNASLGRGKYLKGS